MTTDYPARHKQLQSLMGRLGHDLPGPVAGFGRLHNEAVANGALTSKTKELMALAIAVAVHCESCIAYHVHDALKAGATSAEIIETLGVAILMGGGPAAMYACDALEALNQFQAAAPTNA